MSLRTLTPWLSLSTVLVLLLASSLGAQTGDAPPRYRIEPLGDVDATDLSNVVVHFRVVDANGEPARDLPDEEFVIYEDGKEVKRFRPKGLRATPMAAVLAMDTSGSMERTAGQGSQVKLQAAKGAAGTFFQKLAPSAPCGLVLFSHETYQTVPLTSNRDQLRRLIEAAKPRGGTAYLDATAEAIRLLAGAPSDHQRAIVLMTDGRDVNSKRNLQDVIEEARRHRVRVYAVGLGEPGRNETVRTTLVLDHSGSMAGKKIDALHKAASRFIQLMPPEAADTTIVAFDDAIGKPTPFTNNKPYLLSEIVRLKPGSQTALYDATYEGIETLNAVRDLDRGRSRRAVVVLTDGEDTNSRRRETDVIERASRDGIKVYMLGLGQKSEINEPVMQTIARETKGEYFRIENPDQLTDVFEELSIRLHDDGIDEQSLQRLAAGTGGEYYPVQDVDRLSLAFEQVALNLENTYSVTFESKRKRFDGTLRRIEIRLGSLASTEQEVTLHGLITPMGNPGVYLILLAALIVLLAAPTQLRRLFRSSSQTPA